MLSLLGTKTHTHTYMYTYNSGNMTQQKSTKNILKKTERIKIKIVKIITRFLLYMIKSLSGGICFNLRYVRNKRGIYVIKYIVMK